MEDLFGISMDFLGFLGIFDHQSCPASLRDPQRLSRIPSGIFVTRFRPQVDGPIEGKRQKDAAAENQQDRQTQQ